MVKNTLIHIQGIAATTERRVWESGSEKMELPSCHFMDVPLTLTGFGPRPTRRMLGASPVLRRNHDAAPITRSGNHVATSGKKNTMIRHTIAIPTNGKMDR